MSRKQEIAKIAREIKAIKKQLKAGMASDWKESREQEFNSLVLPGDLYNTNPNGLLREYTVQPSRGGTRRYPHPEPFIRIDGRSRGKIKVSIGWIFFQYGNDKPMGTTRIKERYEVEVGDITLQDVLDEACAWFDEAQKDFDVFSRYKNHEG